MDNYNEDKVDVLDLSIDKLITDVDQDDNNSNIILFMNQKN